MRKILVLTLKLFLFDHGVLSVVLESIKNVWDVFSILVLKCFIIINSLCDGKGGNDVFQLRLILKSNFTQVPVGNYKPKMISHSDLHFDGGPLSKCVSHDRNKHVQHVDNQEEWSKRQKSIQEWLLTSCTQRKWTVIDLSKDNEPNVPNCLRHGAILEISFVFFWKVIEVQLNLGNQIKTYGDCNHSDHHHN